MKNKTHLFLVLALLCIFIGMSCVSASDIGPTLSNNQTSTNDHSPTEEITTHGSYEDLNHDIQDLQPGDTYNMDKDYHFDGSERLIIIDPNVIIIDKDNITINGNGHVIDAGETFYAIFKVTGNNVKILNLTLINSKPQGINMPMNSIMDNQDYRKTYHDVLSPISWYGDNGVISDCKFADNEAINGGAICWKGNNGIINKCTFINNTARGIGGAIYMAGSNNTMSHSLFINSFGQLSHEAVYLDRSRKDINFTECEFANGGKHIIDGTVTNIDVNYLCYNIDSYISDIKFNIAHTLYSSIMNGGLNYMDNGISYYAQYNNKTHDFTLTVTRYFDEYGLAYRKDYTFKNITELNEIFDLMYDGNFVNDLIFMVNMTVSSKADYNAARTTMAVEILSQIDDLLERDLGGYLHLNIVNFVLNVNFESAISIGCIAPWIPSIMGYDIVIINGHGSTIHGSYDESDEYNWLILDSHHTFIASDLYIEGYNTAVNNMGGECTFNRVTFKDNRMDYYFKRDWGGAIINTGVISCNNCSFIHNYAKNGGAVFNQGWINLENCTFSNNKAYGTGSNVCIGEGGLARVNGIDLTGDYGPVYFATSYSLTDITLLSILCIGATVAISFFAGAASGGLLTSIALGFCIGAIFGIVGAKIASDRVFDLNFDSTTYAAVIIGGSILAGVGAAVLGCTFFSQATCCDYWCVNMMEAEPGFFYADSATASSLSEEGSQIAEDLISVISGMTS